MAVKPLVGMPNPLDKFAQSSLTPIGGALAAHILAGMTDPLAHFAQSTLAPTGAGKPFKPLPPLPGIAVSGGSYGFPI